MEQTSGHCEDPDQCKALLELLINNQVHGKQKEELMTKIKACLACYKRYELDALIRRVLQNHACACPQSVLERIHTQISNEQ